MRQPAFICAATLLALGTFLGRAPAADESARSAREQELLAVLRGGAPEADKAITCKLLAVHGSSAAVADLTRLLDDERLASWARIALEAIPGPEADAALRSAAERLSGRLRVGPINSLGVRRDAGAVDLLAKLLADADPETAAAAAAALGRIGTAEAAAPLAAALARGGAITDAVAEACVVCAENLGAAGPRSEAASLYELVRTDTRVAEQRRAEATRGLVVLRGTEGLPLLLEALRSPARRLANMGLFTARELGRGERPDAALAEAVDLALVKEVAATRGGNGLPADRAVLLVDVLAERNAGAGRPAVEAALVETAKAGPKPLRLAAIAALGRVGGPAVVESLLAVAADPDSGYAPAVRAALAALPGGEVDQGIRRRLATADAARLAVLVAAVGDRRIGAVGELLPLVDHGDADVRRAALEALGGVVGLGDLEVLLSRAVAPSDEAEATVVRSALKAACVRMPDRDGCAAKVAAAMAAAAKPEDKAMFLEMLGDVGGPGALAAVAAAAKGDDAGMQDVATRLLGSWMTADAAPVLLELAASDSSRFQTRTLRGYIRIARQFALPEAERAEMCRKALASAREPVDRKAVLAILVRYPHAATLAVAEEAAKLPGIEAEGAEAAAGIRAKLAGQPAAAVAADPWLVVAGESGVGKGRRIVLVSGDEEYRSEEGLTQLAKILARHHGFDCTVLYAIDPATGTIAPDEQRNIPGLEALRQADLMVIATRFRDLPDGQMKEIDDYLRSGRPVVGLRTATHAFRVPKDRAYARYSFDAVDERMPQGFGRHVLGETWIAHHGRHGSESTRGILAPDAQGHPILRGIADRDIWGPTDVYAVRLPLPGDSRPLVLGQVLVGMKPDDPPLAGAKNDPMMPVAWTKTYAIDGGPQGRVFTTTMGASTDLASAGLRRLIVNACYWCLGLEERIPAQSVVDVVGVFEPSPFGFKKAKLGVKPADLR